MCVYVCLVLFALTATLKRGGCAYSWPKTEGSSVHHKRPNSGSAEYGDWNPNLSRFEVSDEIRRRKFLYSRRCKMPFVAALPGQVCNPYNQTLLFSVQRDIGADLCFPPWVLTRAHPLQKSVCISEP